MYGDVAQLGERAVRIRKVESSILFVSTIPYHYALRGVFFFYRKAVLLKNNFMNESIISAFPGLALLPFSPQPERISGHTFSDKEA